MFRQGQQIIGLFVSRIYVELVSFICLFCILSLHRPERPDFLGVMPEKNHGFLKKIFFKRPYEVKWKVNTGLYAPNFSTPFDGCIPRIIANISGRRISAQSPECVLFKAPSPGSTDGIPSITVSEFSNGKANLMGFECVASNVQ